MKKSQQGDSLIEAIIGVILISIMVLGLIYTTTQAERANRDTKVSGLVIAKMRDMLQKDEDPDDKTKKLSSRCGDTLTNAIKLPTSADSTQRSLDLTLSCSSKNISINGYITTTKIMKLSTTEASSSLLGGIIEVGENE